MARIEKTYEGLCLHGGSEGITAGDLAKRLQLSRANCSFDLNRLWEEGRARKTGSKPVFYHPIKANSTVENPFQTFIRRNPSLAKCGDLAKAAVLYPPHGMNILLLGETGVGKSMFAALIHEFSCSVKKNTARGPLITFNCADYSNNPQLLISQLFGVVKGAYTGAGQDKPGLLEHADGGILFLDEVHRLPAEGQEMLFTYIDRGVFRRLGETNSERRVTVMLICATTEDPGSALLQTFQRRLPVVIHLPSLTERSLEERQQLIALFFSQEAVRLNAPVFVTVNSMRALLGYYCKGNIGQLSADIRLLCARAYADYISEDKEKIQITSFSLPPHIRNGFLNQHSRKELWNSFGVGHGRFLTFQADGTIPDFDAERQTDIYELMEQQTSNMKRVGIPDKDIFTEINSLLDQYYQRMSKENSAVTPLENLVGPEIVATAEKILAYAGRILNRTFSSNIRYGLALHIFNTLRRLREKKAIEHPWLIDVRTNYPLEWEAALECLKMIENDFTVRLPMDEAAFLAHFFTADSCSSLEYPMVQVIVIAHGSGTATGMCDVANHLLDMQVVTGFDMPMEQIPTDTYKQVRQFLEERPHVREILLLVDMGSLNDFANDLIHDLSLTVRTVTMVSTLHVVEAGRMAALGHPLEDIYQKIYHISHLGYGDTSTVESPGSARLFILSVCTTGDGSAQMLRRILEEQLDLENCCCEIRQLSIADPRAFQRNVEKIRKKGHIVAVAGTFKTDLEVLHVPLTDVLSGSGIVTLQKRLNWESLRFRMADTISGLLDRLDPVSAISEAHNMVSSLVLELNADLSEEMMVGIFSHLIFMLNRLKKGDSTPLFPNKEAIRKKYPGVIAKVERKCRLLGRHFHVDISDDEVCYISAFFTKENFNQLTSTWDR